MSVWSIFVIPFIIGGALTLFILLGYGLLATAVNATMKWLWS